MDTHGFANLPSLKAMRQAHLLKTAKIPVGNGYSQLNKLTYKSMVQFDCPLNDTTLVDPSKPKAQATHTNLTMTINGEDLYSRNTLPIFEQQHTPSLESTANLQEWRANEGFSRIGKAKKHNFLSEKTIVSEYACKSSKFPF